MSKITYHEPYPTIGQLIKNKNYDYVSYRLRYREDEPDGEFCGCFAAKDGNIISLDGDCYGLDEEVLISEEWSYPEEGIKNGLTVVVPGKEITRDYLDSCDEWDEDNNESLKKSKRNQRLNKHKRDLKYRHHLKRLCELVLEDCYYYPVHKEKSAAKKPKTYYKRTYREKNRIKYLKKQSNRKVRHYKGELHKGGQYRKVYEVWWQYD